MRYLAWMLVLCSCILSKGFGQEIYSFEVRDLQTNETIAEMEAQLPAVPASTWKVITCHLAYSELGPEYRFKTTLIADGPVENGELNGDLIIVGGGDPTTGSKYFDRDDDHVFGWIIKALRKAGIGCIKGQLIIDASEWGTSTVPWTWPWYDLGNYYASGAWSVNYLDNANELEFELADKIGSPRLVEYSGPFALHYINELQTGEKGSGDGSYIFGAPFQNERVIRGTLPPGPGSFTIRGSIPEPPAFYGEKLLATLETNGIQSEGLSVRYSTSNIQGRSIGEVSSPPLVELIRIALLESDNLYCESFFRALTGSKTYSASTARMRDLMVKKYGLDIPVYDGAGLSPFNRISASRFNDILVMIHRNDPEFWSLMPDITNTSLNGHYSRQGARMKSGFMENVRSYVGIIDDRYGVTLLYNGSDHQSNNVKKRMAAFLKDAVK